MRRYNTIVSDIAQYLIDRSNEAGNNDDFLERNKHFQTFARLFE